MWHQRASWRTAASWRWTGHQWKVWIPRLGSQGPAQFTEKLTSSGACAKPMCPCWSGPPAHRQCTCSASPRSWEKKGEPPKLWRILSPVVCILLPRWRCPCAMLDGLHFGEEKGFFFSFPGGVALGVWHRPCIVYECFVFIRTLISQFVVWIFFFKVEKHLIAFFFLNSQSNTYSLLKKSHEI